MQIAEHVSRLGIRLDEVQRAKVEVAASAAGLSMSEWARNALMSAAEAESVPAKPPPTHPEPNAFLLAVKRAAAARERTT